MDAKRLDHIRAWARVYRGHLPSESHPHAAMVFELLDALDEAHDMIHILSQDQEAYLRGKKDGWRECVEVCQDVLEEEMRLPWVGDGVASQVGRDDGLSRVCRGIAALCPVPVPPLPPDAMRKEIEHLQRDNERLREECRVLDLENTRLLGAVEAQGAYFDENGEEMTVGRWQELRHRIMNLPANVLPASDNSNANYASTTHPDSPPPAP